MSNKYVIQSNSLGFEEINSLLNNKVLAIIVSKYITKDQADADVKELLSDSKTRILNDKAGNLHLMWQGNSLFDFLRDTKDFEDYILSIQKDIRKGSPMTNRLDNRKLELVSCFNEIWPEKVQPLKVNNNDCDYGIWRVVMNYGEALPHQDNLKLPEYRWAPMRKFKSQISAVLYLQVPEEGGELEIWDRKIPLKNYIKLREKNAFGINREFVTKPHVIIKPKVADLILFNSLNLHAVQPWLSGNRSTFNFFIGYYGVKSPLYLFS